MLKKKMAKNIAEISENARDYTESLSQARTQHSVTMRNNIDTISQQLQAYLQSNSQEQADDIDKIQRRIRELQEANQREIQSIQSRYGAGGGSSSSSSKPLSITSNSSSQGELRSLKSTSNSTNSGASGSIGNVQTASLRLLSNSDSKPKVDAGRKFIIDLGNDSDESESNDTTNKSSTKQLAESGLGRAVKETKTGQLAISGRISSNTKTSNNGQAKAIASVPVSKLGTFASSGKISNNSQRKAIASVPISKLGSTFKGSITTKKKRR